MKKNTIKKVKTFGGFVMAIGIATLTSVEDFTNIMGLFGLVAVIITGATIYNIDKFVTPSYNRYIYR